MKASSICLLHQIQLGDFDRLVLEAVSANNIRSSSLLLCLTVSQLSHFNDLFNFLLVITSNVR
jgi:hypothetical protein